MQELSLLEEKLVNGGVLVTGNPEARSALRNTDNIKWGPLMPGTNPARKGKHSEAFLEAVRRVDPNEEKYEGKKIKSSTGKWVTVRTGSGIDFKD